MAMKTPGFQIQNASRHEEIRRLLESSEVPAIRQRLRGIEDKIQIAGTQGLPRDSVVRLASQAAALEQILTHAEARHPALGGRAPKNLPTGERLWTASEIRERIAWVKAEIIKVPRGQPAAAEPLRQELKQLSEALEEASERQFKFPTLLESDFAHLAKGKTRGHRAPEKVHAFAARYFSDSAQMPETSCNARDASTPKAKVVAQDVTQSVLGVSVDDSHFLFGDKAHFYSLAAGCVVQAKGDVDEAKKLMENAVLRSEHGFYPVMRDLRFAFRAANRKGIVSDDNLAQAQNLLDRLSQPTMTSWVNGILERRPDTSKSEVVKELFLEINVAAQRQAEKANPAERFQRKPVRALTQYSYAA